MLSGNLVSAFVDRSPLRREAAQKARRGPWVLATPSQNADGEAEGRMLGTQEDTLTDPSNIAVCGPLVRTQSAPWEKCKMTLQGAFQGL